MKQMDSKVDLLDTDTENGVILYQYIEEDNEIFLEHFPNNPIYPGSMMINSVLTTFDIWMSRLGRTDWNSHRLRLEQVRFREICRPGMSIRIEIQRLGRDFEKSSIKGTSAVGAAQLESIMTDIHQEDFKFTVVSQQDSIVLCTGSLIIGGRN